MIKVKYKQLFLFLKIGGIKTTNIHKRWQQASKQARQTDSKLIKGDK